VKRYRQDATSELYDVEQRIKSNRKSAHSSTNRKTAGIADAVLPSLMRRAEELRAEIAMLPERPAYTFAHTDGNFPCLSRVKSFTQTELEELEIPEFLRRHTI
jgi:hypothetical protein